MMLLIVESSPLPILVRIGVALIHRLKFNAEKTVYKYICKKLPNPVQTILNNSKIMEIKHTTFQEIASLSF